MTSIKQSNQSNNFAQTASEGLTNEWGTDRRRQEKEWDCEAQNSHWDDPETEQEREQWRQECDLRDRHPYESQQQWERQCDQERDVDYERDDREHETSQHPTLRVQPSQKNNSSRPLSVRAGSIPIFRRSWWAALGRSPTKPPTRATSSFGPDQDWVLIEGEEEEKGEEPTEQLAEARHLEEEQKKEHKRGWGAETRKYTAGLDFKVVGNHAPQDQLFRRSREEIKCIRAEERKLPKDTFGAESGWTPSFPIAPPEVYASASPDTPTTASPGIRHASLAHHPPNNVQQKFSAQNHPQVLPTNDLSATVRDVYPPGVSMPQVPRVVVHENRSPYVPSKLLFNV